MVRINRNQFEELRKAGLIKDKRNSKDPNYYVANKEHCSRDKTYYVTEDPKIMLFLGLLKERPRNNQGYNKNRNYNKNTQK